MQFKYFLTILFFAFCLSFNGLYAQKGTKDTTERITSLYEFSNDSIRFLSDSLSFISQTYIGTPYKYGGNGPKSFDCSGFTSHIYKKFGHALPRRATDQYHAYPLVPRTELRVGDLVFFQGRSRNNSIGHVGIVIKPSDTHGVFDFIHASTTQGVVITNSEQAYYKNRYMGASRVLDGIYLQLALESIPKQKKETAKTPSTSKTEKKYHTVKKGETLSSIARKYQTSVDKLRTMNRIKGSHLAIGQVLLVKEEKKEMPKEQQEETANLIVAPPEIDLTNEQGIQEPKEAAQPTTYTVQAGDTLYRIASIYGITIEELKEYNNLTGNTIQPGQVLKISL